MSAPFDSLSMADAAVTLRSLPRRFTETVSGPAGDDSWDRTVRTTGPSGRSALGSVAVADAELVALGTAIASLPLEKSPIVNLGPVRRSPEPKSSVTELLAQIKVNAVRAATAVEGRGHDDFSRQLTVDGKTMAADEYVRRTVAACLSHLTDAKEAIESAT
jgi:hypothetical protein